MAATQPTVGSWLPTAAIEQADRKFLGPVSLRWSHWQDSQTAATLHNVQADQVTGRRYPPSPHPHDAAWLAEAFENGWILG